MTLPFSHTDNTENVPGFTASMAEIETLAQAIWITSMQYRAVPHYPVCDDLRKIRWDQYQQCLAEMRELLK